MFSEAREAKLNAYERNIQQPINQMEMVIGSMTLAEEEAAIAQAELEQAVNKVGAGLCGQE